MSSKRVGHARVLTRQVATGLRKHARPAAAEIDKGLEAAGAPPFNLAPVVQAAAVRVEATFASFEAAEDKVVSEVGQDRDTRDRRDEMTSELRDKILALSSAVSAAYGREGLKRLNLAGPTPDPPEQIVGKAKGFLSATLEGIPGLPEPVQPWCIPDLLAARVDIADLTPGLQAALDGVSGEVRETQKARTGRTGAQLAWYSDLRFGADLARAVLRRASQEELALRLIPSESNIDRIEPEEPEEPEEPMADEG